jgi:hypothetical protein
MLVFRAGNRDFQGGVARPLVVARLSFAHTDRRRAARRGKLGRRPHHPLMVCRDVGPGSKDTPLGPFTNLKFRHLQRRDNSVYDRDNAALNVLSFVRETSVSRGRNVRL